MNSPYTFIISLLLLLVVTANTTNLIKQTCKNSSKNDPNINYKFCFYALQSFPASQCAKLTKLGQISITLTKYNVTDIRCSIKQILQHKKLHNETKEALVDCLELYSVSLPTLSEAIIDYKAKRFFDANVKVSSVMDASITCEEGFEDVGVDSPLKKHNKRVFQLSAIALSIINSFDSPDM